MPTYNLASLKGHDRLQMSAYELQTRVGFLASFGEDYASKGGKRDKWLITDAGLEVLIKTRELEQQGLSIERAFERIRAELIGQPSEFDQAKEAQVSQEVLGLLRERLAEKDAQIQWLQDEHARLLNLLSSFTQRALPAGPSDQRAGKDSSKRFRWPWRRG